MPTASPFDPSSLPTETEVATRARHDSVEWAPSSPRRIVHEDYTLDPGFDDRPFPGVSVNHFNDGYDDVPVHVTSMEEGVLFGQRFFLCGSRVPSVSAERSYLVRANTITEKLEMLERLDVPNGPTYLVGANGGYHNHYHWTFQCLPNIALLRTVARARGLDYRIVLPPLSARHLRSLELLGVAPEECLTLESDRFLQDVRLMYSTATSGRYSFSPSSRLIELLDPYRDACLDGGSEGLPTRFYVSRRDAAGKRRIENEAELASALEARGHEEIVMSRLSLEDQVCLFARAESIVAPHGAGLVNLMYAPPTASLVEIMPEHYRYAHFFRLAQVRGMTYSEVRSRIVEEDEHDPRQGNLLSADIEKVLAALDRVSSASASLAA